MKKSYRRKLLSVLLFLSMSNVFAASLTCPSAEEIKNVKFIQAHNLVQDFWLLTSDAFNHGGVDWNVWTESELVDVKIEEDAIKRGQKHFNEIALITEPTPSENEGATVCVYSRQNDPVLAITPPLFQPLSQPLKTFIK